MAGLKIGGYKGNSADEAPTMNVGSVEDIDETVVEGNDVGDEPAGDEPNGDEPDNTGVDDTDTGDEPAGDEPKGDEPTTTETGQDAGEPADDNSSLKPNDEENTQNTREFGDEDALKYLSEKLGKEIKSLDELNQPSENPLDSDPVLKELHEWRSKTGRPIEDWFKYQKDFSKVDDLEVAREFLQLEYPNLDNEDIELELKRFTPSEEDLEDEARMKKLELKKYATKGRSTLEGLKSKLAEPDTANYSPEIKEKIEFADKVKAQMDSNTEMQKEYEENLMKAATSVEELPIKLGDDLNIGFKVSEQDRKELPKFISEMPHWRDEKGNLNHKTMAEDGIKIKYFDQLVKLAYEQGLSSGQEKVIKDTKNTTLGKTTTMDSNSESGKGVQIEGLDNFLGKKGMKVRKFGN